MTAELTASPPPSPVGTTVTPGFGPTQGTSGDVGASAGLYAFLVVVGLIAASVVIFIAMNRSLKTARHNLGGSVLPRRVVNRIPVAPQPPPQSLAPSGEQPPADVPPPGNERPPTLP